MLTPLQNKRSGEEAAKTADFRSSAGILEQSMGARNRAGTLFFSLDSPQRLLENFSTHITWKSPILNPSLDPIEVLNWNSKKKSRYTPT
jgi:hypothetical protein